MMLIHTRVFVILLALVTLNAFAEAQVKPKLNRAHRKNPVVLLVPYAKYGGPRELANPIKSTCALAMEFQKLFFEVTVISDDHSQAKLTSEIGKLNGVKILQANDVAELRNAIDVWIDGHFANKDTSPPYALIGFSGHGEVRGMSEEPFFLTTRCEPGHDGYSIHKLQESIGKRDLPIFLVVDTCREKVDPPKSPEKDPNVSEREPTSRVPEKAAAQLIRSRKDTGVAIRTRPFGTKGGQRDEHAVSPVSTIWATSSGRMAPDQSDLFSALADGLRSPKDRKTFQARFRFPPNGVEFRTDTESELPFLVWYLYAIAYYVDHHGGGTSMTPPILDTGSIDSMMICASRAPNYEYQTIKNLQSSWTQANVTQMQVDTSAEGLVLTRPAGTDRNSTLYVTGLVDRITDFRGKTLAVDVFARCPGDAPTTHMKAMFQPQNHTVQLGYYSSQWQTPEVIPWGRQTTIVIPLDQGKEGDVLTAVAISPDSNDLASWPVGSSLTVTGMKLISGERQPPPSVEAWNLMGRWWFIDNMTDGKRNTVASMESGPKSQLREWHLQVAERVDGQLSCRGGPLFPRLYVDNKFQHMEIAVKSCRPAKGGKVEVILADENGVLAHWRSWDQARQNFIGRVQPIKILRSGQADYMAIITDSEDLVISSLRIVPGAIQ